MRRRIAIVVAGLALVGCVHAGSSSSSSVPVAPSIAPDPAAVAAVLPADGTLVVRARGSRFRIYEQPGAGAVLTRTLAATNDWAQPLWLPRHRWLRRCRGRDLVRGPAAGPSERDDGMGPCRRGGRPRGRRADRGGSVRASPVALRGRAHGRILQGRDRHAGVTDGAGALLRVGARARPTRRVPTGCLRSGCRGSPTSSPTGSAAGASRSTATAASSDRGADVSHGCVRVFNPQMITLADVLARHAGLDPPLRPGLR